MPGDCLRDPKSGKVLIQTVYLLDTNHCSRLIQGNDAVVRQIALRGHELMATCIIVQGELLYMGHNSRDTEGNLARIRDFLGTVQILTIDDEAAERYGQIKTAILLRWGPRERAKRRHFDLGDAGFSDNDIWIAAIALRFGLIVVSGDSDFGRITEVVPLLHENWLTLGTTTD